MGSRTALKNLARPAAVTLVLLAPALPAAAADPPPPASIETIVQFHTVCNNRHEGQRQLRLEFDGAAEGSARIDDERMETVADERLCRDSAKTVEFAATAWTGYFLHLKAGTAILRRITFR